MLRAVQNSNTKKLKVIIEKVETQQSFIKNFSVALGCTLRKTEIEVQSQATFLLPNFWK